MKHVVVLIGILPVICGCGHNKTKNQVIRHDSSVVPAATPTPAEEVNIALLRKEYVASYSRENKLDTTFSAGNDKFRVVTRHYCLFDSAVYIPEKYNWDDTTKDFVTHTYRQDIDIYRNSKKIFSRTVKKEDFSRMLFPDLVKHAVIFTADFEGYNSDTGEFEFVYSISIPMTDVGMSTKLYVDLLGKTRVTD